MSDTPKDNTLNPSLVERALKRLNDKIQQRTDLQDLKLMVDSWYALAHENERLRSENARDSIIEAVAKHVESAHRGGGHGGRHRGDAALLRRTERLRMTHDTDNDGQFGHGASLPRRGDSGEARKLLDRLSADGGRYLLVIGQEEKTFDSFGVSVRNRFLTDAEHAAVVSALSEKCQVDPRNVNNHAQSSTKREVIQPIIHNNHEWPKFTADVTGMQAIRWRGADGNYRWMLHAEAISAREVVSSSTAAQEAEAGGTPQGEVTTGAPAAASSTTLDVLGQAAIRELRGLEQTAVMLEKQAPEVFPDVKDGKVHFGRAVMESAAEAIRQAWANVIAAGTNNGGSNA